VENRLRVLRTLTDAVLSTAALRDVLQNEGQLPLEDHCRVCHRLGDMVSPFLCLFMSLLCSLFFKWAIH
jgi:hypothetical protein